MSITSAIELEGMRRAGRVVARALAAMKGEVRPGITTGELDAVAAAVLAFHGARSAPQHDYGFPGTACISVNEEAVHGIPGARQLVAGDLVTLDVTVEVDGFYADAAVTVPVGAASPRARRLVAAAEAAFWRAADLARSGQRLAAVGGAVEAEVERRGFRVLRDLCGHGIGRAIHEEPSVCNYFEPRERAVLTEGLVLALEPIVSETARASRQGPDGWTLHSADGSLTAHFEHTLVVTRGRPQVLTAA